MCIFLRNHVFRFGQKIIRWRAGAIFLIYARKKNVYHSQDSKFFHKKRQSCEFSTKNESSVKKSVKFSVKKFLSILCSHSCGNIYTRFHVLERAEQYYKWPERNVGNGYIVGFISKEPQASYW